MKTILGLLTFACALLVLVALVGAAPPTICTGGIEPEQCRALHRELHAIFPDATRTAFGVKLMDRTGGFWSLQVRSHPSIGFNPMWAVAWGRTPEIRALFFRGEDGLELLASD